MRSSSARRLRCAIVGAIAFAMSIRVESLRADGARPADPRHRACASTSRCVSRRCRRAACAVAGGIAEDESLSHRADDGARRYLRASGRARHPRSRIASSRSTYRQAATLGHEHIPADSQSSRPATATSRHHDGHRAIAFPPEQAHASRLASAAASRNFIRRPARSSGSASAARRNWRSSAATRRIIEPLFVNDRAMVALVR